MAVEINQIPITTTSITSSSFFPLDLATGGSPAYETRKATLNTIANEVLDEQLTGDRFLNINGNVMNLYGGQVSIGTPLASNYALEVSNSSFAGGGLFYSSGVAVRSVSTTGIGISAEGISGLQAYSTSGNAVHGISISGGLGGKFEGGAYIETYGFGGSAEASAVFEASATTKGALMPRMTTTQRDAIPSPATGLEIFNTTTNRKEYYNGTYWAGEKQIINIFHGSNWNPNNAQTVVFSGTTLAPQVAPYSVAMQLKLKGAGVIRSCTLNTIATSVVGTNEAWSLYIRINSTDYLVATVTTNTSGVRVFENLSLNIPYVDGDLFQMVFVNPTWSTRPQGVVSHGTVTLE